MGELFLEYSHIGEDIYVSMYLSISIYIPLARLFFVFFLNIAGMTA